MQFNFEHIVSRNRYLGWHFLFWGVVLLFYTVFFGHQNANYRFSLLFVGMLLPVTMATLYFLNYWLIPRFLFTKRYRRFLLFLSYTFIIASWLQMWVLVLTFITIAQYKPAQMTPASMDIFFLAVSLYLVVFVGVAVKLFKHWYQAQQKNRLLVQDKLEAELRLKKIELQLLKAQIHPHFLFNTLNSLYGLTLEKSDHAPEVVIKLSSLLDYLLYRCNQPRVLLKDEIEHLQNFIALEQLRYENKLQLSFDIQGKVANQNIAPMLILPFVENCFKHGVSHHLSECWIEIGMEVQADAMKLHIKNSKPKVTLPKINPEGSGIGLENVQKRLDLLYRDKHRFEIENKEEEFGIHLSLSF